MGRVDHSFGAVQKIFADHERRRHHRRSPSLRVGSANLFGRHHKRSPRRPRRHSRRKLVLGCCYFGGRSKIVSRAGIRCSTRHGRRSSPPRDGDVIGRRRGVGDEGAVPTMVAPFAQMISCRVDHARNNFRRPPARYSPTRFRRCARTRDYVPEHRASHSRPRFARDSARRSDFPSDAAALPLAETSSTATASADRRHPCLRHEGGRNPRRSPSHFPPPCPARASPSAARARLRDVLPLRQR